MSAVDRTTSPRSKRCLRVEIEAEVLTAVEDFAEAHQTTAGAFVAMMVREKFPVPQDVTPC